MVRGHTVGFVQGICPGAAGVDHHGGSNRERAAATTVDDLTVPLSVASFGRGGLDVVGGGRPVVQRGAYEPEDEARVVVFEVGVRILQAAGQSAWVHLRLTSRNICP